jgi:hypothetical protein
MRVRALQASARTQRIRAVCRDQAYTDEKPDVEAKIQGENKLIYSKMGAAYNKKTVNINETYKTN